MVVNHFGLRQRPFRPTPDTGSYYPATGHEQVLERLLQALTEDEGLNLLVGAPGTGKTLLCHCLADRLGETVTSAFLTNCRFRDCTALLQALLFDLSIPYEGRGEQEMRLALTDYLLRNYSEGRRSLLILDEAQHLTPDLLEELRLLGNLEGNGGRAVQVLLVGQMGLLDTLRLPELASFNQRLAVRLQVEPLNVQEAADYVLHQIRVAGGRPEEIITEEALEVLARATHGIPRLLNQAASQSLNLAHSIGAEQVDAEVVFEAIAALGLEMPEPLETHESPTHEDLMTDADPVFIEETTTSYSREEEPKTTLSGPAEHNSSGGRVHRLFAAPRRPA